MLKSKSWTPSIKWGRKVFFLKVKVLNWTWTTDPVMYGYKKNLVGPTNKADLGVCYQILCTNLGNGILYTLLQNHNIHWCLSAMDNICFKAKKCVGNTFLCKQLKNSNLWEKTTVDKSAWIKAWHLVTFQKNTPDFRTRIAGFLSKLTSINLSPMPEELVTHIKQKTQSCS